MDIGYFQKKEIQGSRGTSFDKGNHQRMRDKEIQAIEREMEDELTKEVEREDSIDSG